MATKQQNKAVVSKAATSTVMTAAKSASELNRQSMAFGKTSKEFNEMLHTHALKIAAHISAYGDVTPATFLVAQLKSGHAHVNPLRQWFLDFAGCTWNAAKGTFGKRKEFKYDEKAASENPFYLWSREPEFKPVDGIALLRSIVNKMHKALKDTEHKDQHKVDAEMLKSLDVLLAKVDPRAEDAKQADENKAKPIPVSPTEVSVQAVVH